MFSQWGVGRGQGSSPDSQCGLDEGGDAHAGEDRPDELADHVLVPAHTQRLRQEEGHSNGATEACQVMLGAGRVREAAPWEPGRPQRSSHLPQGA